MGNCVSFHEAARPFDRSHNPPGLHAMIDVECYFDDSSDERRERYFACGGFVGSPDQWDMFDAFWSVETYELSEPFHSTDCECGYGQFRDWPIPKRNDLMARLTAVVNKAGLLGYASILPVADFKSVFPGMGNREAMRIVFAHIMVNMAHIANQADKSLALWFENSPYDGVATNVLNDLREAEWPPSQRLRGPHFESKELRPLQSADLVAREAFKHVDNLGVRPMRKSLIQISESLFFMLWNRGTLEHFAANGGPGNLRALWESRELPDANKLTHFFWNRSWDKKAAGAGPGGLIP